MDFLNEVSNDANGSKVPRNGKILLFWSLDLLRFADFFASILLKMKRKKHSTGKSMVHRLHIISLFLCFKGLKCCFYSKRVFFFQPFSAATHKLQYF